MGRSAYVDDYDCDGNWRQIMWRGQVASSIRGKRGQAFLREMLDALDAMPQKRLIENALRQDGEVCAIGSVGARRGIDMGSLDPEDYVTISEVFGIASPLVREIEYVNDECGYRDTPEERWSRVREWVASEIRK